MNKIKQFIIQMAYNWVAKKHEERLEELNWLPEDSIALDDYLKSISGRKFIAMLGENSNNALRQVMTAKNPDEMQSIKAQAKVWLSIKGNLETMRIKRRDPKANKLSNEKLEEVFSKMVSSSMQVTRHGMKSA